MQMLTNCLRLCIICSVIESQKPERPATKGVPCGGSLPFILLVLYMSKPFLSYQDQIKKLENDKGLIIPNHTYAEFMLKQIGYFALIGGYKSPLKNPTTKKYRDGICFDDIVALYTFDENLRELFLKYLLQIERHIRSLISYYFTEAHGEQQSCYLDPSNYINNPKYKKDVSRLIRLLHNLAVKNTDYPYINHQRKTYGNVPLWVLTNSLTFGSLSKFYLLMTQDLQVKVSQDFTNVNEKQLRQYLIVITKFRNVCAHSERLFSYKTHDAIPDTVLHKKLLIGKKGTQYICGKQDLFSVVISFRYLLPDTEFKKFKAGLTKIIKEYFASSDALSESELFSYMGFPLNWTKITRYKK